MPDPARQIDNPLLHDDPKPTPDPRPAAQEPTPGPAGPTTYRVTVNGTERQVTLPELLKGYNLEQAARERLDQASEQRKQNERAIEIAENVERLLTTGDMTAISALGRKFNLPDDAVKAVIASLSDDGPGREGQQPPGNPTPGNSAGPSEPRQIQLSDLSPEVQKLLERAGSAAEATEARTLTDAREKMFSVADERVDKDEILGILEDGQREYAKTVVKNEVQRRVGLLGETWPDVLTDIVQQARSMVGAFGGSHATAPEESGQAFSAIGPAAAMRSGGYVPAEPVSRVPATDPKYGSNFGTRLLQRLAKLGKRRS